MDEQNKPQARAQLRHDFNAAVHTARVTLRALRQKVTSPDDLELLDGAVAAVDEMAEIFRTLHAPEEPDG